MIYNMLKVIVYIIKQEGICIMEHITQSIGLNYKNDNVDKNEYVEKYDLEKKLKERIIQLEKELQYTKECLQTSNEEHLVYDEELQSINEEFQTSNEELLKINTKYQYKNQELADNLYNTEWQVLLLESSRAKITKYKRFK